MKTQVAANVLGIALWSRSFFDKPDFDNHELACELILAFFVTKLHKSLEISFSFVAGNGVQPCNVTFVIFLCTEEILWMVDNDDLFLSAYSHKEVSFSEM